jgi:WD40 repeat protein
MKTAKPTLFAVISASVALMQAPLANGIAHAASREPSIEQRIDYAQPLVWDSKGNHLAVDIDADESRATILWDTYATHPHRFVSPGGAVSFSPNGKQLAVSYIESTVIFDLKTWKHSPNLDSRLAGPPYNVTWRSGGGMLAVLSAGGISVWKTAKYTYYHGFFDRVIRGSDDGEDTYSYAWSPNGTLIAAGKFGNVTIWDVAKRKHKMILPGYRYNVDTVLWQPSGRLLAAAEPDGLAYIWNVAQHRRIARITGKPAAWSADGKRLVTIGNSAVLEWNPHGRLIAKHACGGWIMDFAVSSSGRRCAVVLKDESIRLLSLDHRGNRGTIIKLPTAQPDNREIAMSANGRRLATSTTDGVIQVWDCHTGRLLGSITTFDNGRQWIIYGSNGYYAATPEGLKLFKQTEMGRRLGPKATSRSHNRPDLVTRALSH